MKKWAMAAFGLAAFERNRRNRNETKQHTKSVQEACGVLLAWGNFAGVASDVLILYQDDALTNKMLIPQSDERYGLLKGVVESKWQFVSRLNEPGGVSIYQKV